MNILKWCCALVLLFSLPRTNNQKYDTLIKCTGVISCIFMSCIFCAPPIFAQTAVAPIETGVICDVIM